jgi:hypothetical protein
MNKLKLGLFWVGVAIVVLTHIYLLFASLPTNQVMGHAILNLVAAGLIIYSWFVKD